MSLRASIRVARRSFDVVVDLEALDGETVALLGPNGSGKTTVLEAIAGLVPLDEGTIELGGTSIHDLPADRRRIGLAFQDAMLFPRFSARENVAFALRARGARAGDARARAGDLLAELAPTVDPEAPPARLSGGERQRVSLARTLASEPRLLLLDEPLAAVDASARPELRQTIRTMLEMFTGPVVLVTHDPVEAMTMAERLVLLERGRVTQTGTPDEVRSHPASRYAADLVGLNLFEGELAPDGEGAGVVRTPTGALTVVWPEGLDRVPVDGVRATVSPADVAVYTEAPEGSPRNVFAGRILEVAIAGSRARLRLDTAPPFVAEVTLGSVERLRLVPGAQVWVSCKAVEVRLMVPGREPDTLSS